MKINCYYLVKMDIISQLRILSSYNELLDIWTSIIGHMVRKFISPIICYRSNLIKFDITK